MSRNSKQKHLLSTVTSTVKIFLATMISLSALIFIVFQITSVNSIAMENDEIKEKLKTIQVANNRLAKEVNELQNYNRIEKLAEKLDLKPAKSAPIRIVVDKQKAESDLSKIAGQINQKKQAKKKVLKAGF